MSNFIQSGPTLDAYWRANILFGSNSASYKFALGKTLIELTSQEKTFVTLEELAGPFSRHITEHLQKSDRQGTSQSSQFLDACRDCNFDQCTPELVSDRCGVKGSTLLYPHDFEGKNQRPFGGAKWENL